MNPEFTPPPMLPLAPMMPDGPEGTPYEEETPNAELEEIPLGPKPPGPKAPP